jgi:hypothetical protein
MKQITNKTILKQGDKTYQPIEIDGVIYWVDKREILPNTWYENSGVLFLSDSVYNKGNNPNNSNPIVTDFNRSIVAQSEPKLDGVPVVNLDSYVDRIAKEILPDDTNWQRRFDIVKGFKSNPNQYTQADIEKAIELARKHDVDLHNGRGCTLIPQISRNEILQQINSISVIEVDEQFKKK